MKLSKNVLTRQMEARSEVLMKQFEFYFEFLYKRRPKVNNPGTNLVLCAIAEKLTAVSVCNTFGLTKYND